jgi:hypothetical protein
MSRSRFRSGNNKRKDGHLSEVGRKKINAYKPVVGPVGVEVITERVSGTDWRNPAYKLDTDTQLRNEQA